MAKKKTPLPKPELAPKDRLFIERRRRGEAQAEAARRYGVTLYQYRRWEGGEEEPPAGAGACVKALEPNEICVLARMRAGMSAAELAQALGISRWWLTQMERGSQPADQLVEAWRDLRGRARRRLRA